MNPGVKLYQSQWMGRFIKLGLEIYIKKIRGLQNNILDLISNNKLALITHQLINEKQVSLIIRNIMMNKEPIPDIIEILKKCTVSDGTAIFKNQKIIFREFIQKN